MNSVVFISDLHLHPENLILQAKFEAFIEWAKVSTKSIYILGDFFHVWIGDDEMDEWSKTIAKQLYSLKTVGISVFYMHGNRDFLLGITFARYAGWEILYEPHQIELNGKKVLLMHGDRYCTEDKAHQMFRRLTRNQCFIRLFLALPRNWRQKLANNIRRHSMQKGRLSPHVDVVESSVIEHMIHEKATILIHGHTHQPGISHYQHKDIKFVRYVLSDWDDRPQLLSYNDTNKFYFSSLSDFGDL